jgi:hypothetical protein
VDGYAYTTLDTCAHTYFSTVRNTSILLFPALVSSSPYIAHRNGSQPTHPTSHPSLRRRRITTTSASRPQRSPASVRIPRPCQNQCSHSQSGLAPACLVQRDCPRQQDPRLDLNLPIAKNRVSVQHPPGAAD